MALKSFVLLLATLFVSVPGLMAGNCGPKFPKGKCSCGKATYDDRLQYVVNCTNENFKDTAVLETLPKETEVLIFIGNNIPELPWNVFGTELNSLKIIDLSSNHIREIRGKSFHHVPNVQRLILNHNNLSISRFGDGQANFHHPRVFSNFINLMELHMTNAFSDNSTEELSDDLHDIFVNSNLTKLIKLHLEQNEISKFKDKRVFCDLPALRDLHLGDNRLTQINFNILCLRNLRFLDLERNRFETVKTKDMIAMDSLQSLPGRTVNLIVDFTYNKFNCDCSLAPFVQWVNETRVSVRNSEHYTCRPSGGGQSNAGENINKVNLKRCKISAKNKQTTGHMTMMFLLVVLSLVLVGLIGVLVYISKERLRKALTPVLNNATKKVHYTTIKDDDAPEVHV